MENINRFIFQVDSDLVKKIYAESDNIKVVDDYNGKSNICVIYFSSNELYYPNTEASFLNAIEKRNKYEWQKNTFPGASRHIFVRDIQKQWYIEGTSAKYNTPSLLAKKLKEFSSNFTIYTIGSSAGGFAAILFGSILDAKRVYAFNAQTDLNDIIKASDAFIDPLLFKHLSNEYISKYFKVSDFLKVNIEYFYFQSSRSRMDIAQYNLCVNKNLLTKIEFVTSNHGFPFFRHDLKHVLCLPPQQLRQLANKSMHPFIFSIKIHGFSMAILLTINAVRKRIGKKVKEKILS